MREIKFRAWNGHKMVHNFINYKTQATFLNARGVLVSSMKLMQYTGLKSKSGVEIYEGDIVNYNGGGDYEFKYKIIMWHGAWCGEPLPHAHPVCVVTSRIYSNIKKKRLEVIGNIYENPELLK